MSDNTIVKQGADPTFYCSSVPQLFHILILSLIFRRLRNGIDIHYSLLTIPRYALHIPVHMPHDA